jgi:hypothetical protein
VSALRFARELARFEGHLAWAAAGGGAGYYGFDAALAASYKTLIEDLVSLDEHLDAYDLPSDMPRVPDMLERAMGVFDALRAREDAASRRRSERSAAEYAEASRRYELAVTVECPYCGVLPGRVCRTAGPSGARNTKGVHVHADRYRAATDPQWKAAGAQRAQTRPAVDTSLAIDCPDCDTGNAKTELRYCAIHRCRAIVFKRGTRCRMPGESAAFPYCHAHAHRAPSLEVDEDADGMDAAERGGDGASEPDRLSDQGAWKLWQEAAGRAAGHGEVEP